MGGDDAVNEVEYEQFKRRAMWTVAGMIAVVVAMLIVGHWLVGRLG